MAYLSAVTLLWAFSFSLIGAYLGQVDSYFSALMRVGLACLVFLPFIRNKQISIRTILQLMGIGGVQLGLMYCFYFQSFRLLSVPEVLLFTVFTPIYVTLIYDLLKKRFNPWYLVTAVIAVTGAVCIKQTSVNHDFFTGFLIVQMANLCFAIGQVWYKNLMEAKLKSVPQLPVFGYFYVGAFIVSLFVFTLFGHADRIPHTTLEWSVLIYLGIIASGLGYFGWNKGACMVNSGALAIMNNALVPAGLIVNILFWNKNINLTNLLIGGGLILLSLVVNETWIKSKIR